MANYVPPPPSLLDATDHIVSTDDVAAPEADPEIDEDGELVPADINDEDVNNIEFVEQDETNPEIDYIVDACAIDFVTLK